MSEKYLIDKSSLTALADITRAYNQTPDTQYSLAEVTEQVKTASENYFNLFGEGITELKSETATTIRGYAFSGMSQETEPYLSVNLPNVTSVGDYAFRKNSFNKINMPRFATTGGYAFYQSVFYRSIYFPLLEATEQGDLSNCDFNGSVYLPNLTTLSARSFSSVSFNSGYMIFKALPVLSGTLGAANAQKMKFFITAALKAEMEAATNWANAVSYAEIREATTYEADYEEVWKMLVEDGHLTEEEIRRDFYAAS